jgi:16S rRNA processing protein RimM
MPGPPADQPAAPVTFAMPPRREPTYTISEAGLMEIGVVTRPHGIQGEVRVQIPLEYADALLAVTYVYVEAPAAREPAEKRRRRVQASRMHQDVWLLKLEDADTRDDAEALRGAFISVQVEDMPDLGDEAFYIHELLGLRVVGTDGLELGELVEVLTTGANDVYVVKGDGREVLLPAIPSVIQHIDLEAGVMTVAVPDGLL